MPVNPLLGASYILSIIAGLLKTLNTLLRLRLFGAESMVSFWNLMAGNLVDATSWAWRLRSTSSGNVTVGLVSSASIDIVGYVRK